METVKSVYRQLRARTGRYNNARDAIAAARQHIVVLQDYRAKLDAWKAQPDKRRYAPGGQANRPQYPALFSSRPEPSFLDGLRNCGHVDELFPRAFDHRGYFADTWQDEIYRGQVWQLPARDGRCQYVAGYVEPQSDYPVMVTCDDGSLEIFSGDNPGNHWSKPEALKDAARAADHIAERNAESARRYDEKWQEASQANDARDEARDELKAARKQAGEVLAALREQRALGIAERVCNLLRANLDECRADMRRAIESIHAHSDIIESLDMKGEF